MKRMLFNATQAEELRVAIVDGQKLVDLDIESASKEQRKSNIYKGIVTRVEPSLEAAFIDYGTDRHGFLPFKEVSRACFANDVADVSRARIQDVLREGQEIIVQVEKDERGNKGAALTTYISLAGRYLVLMPNNPRGGGVSRRIEGEERNELRDVMAQLEIPSGMSIIARTAGIGRGVEELQWDLNYLLQLWNAIDSAANSQKGAFLIYQESSLVIRAIRDYFQPDIGEILIDTEEVFEQAQQFMSHVMPGNVHKVKLYKDDVPLFSRFQIEHQIESAYSREVTLPSGGAIVIDHTEALVSVDVNSARSTRGSDIEQTAYNTNLEAAEEVARQLRLRDLGGLIVIDFIDMESQRNQREVENRLRDSLHYDRARVQFGKISKFGLMELSRQRLQPSLGESSHQPCPRCSGTGFIRGIESTALHILRIIQEDAMKENTGAIHAQIPVDVATFLLNEKRSDIFAIESRLKVNVLLIPNIYLVTPHYKITRLRHDELNQHDITIPSYKLADAIEDASPTEMRKENKPAPQVPAVRGITPAQPAPIVEQKLPAQVPTQTEPKSGLIGRIFGWLQRIGEEKPPQPIVAQQPAEPVREPRETRGRGRQRGERTERPQRPVEAQEGSGRTERAPRPERGPRPERQAGERPATPADSAQKPTRKPRQQQPRTPKPAGEVVVTNAVAETDAPVQATTTDISDETRSRRGRRGGRRERRPEQDQTSSAAEMLTTRTGGAEVEGDVEVMAQPVAAPTSEPVTATVTTPQAATAPAPIEPSAPVETRPVTVASESIPAVSKADATKALMPVEKLLSEMLAPSPAAAQLQQVETQAKPAAAIVPDVTEQAPRRRRKPPAMVADTPVELMQVETKNAVTAPAESTIVASNPVPQSRQPRRAAVPQQTAQEAPLQQIETRR
ncbi:ribonuclease E [Sulfuriferula plumbiphila]|uniref:Ribonuclease E n=1 Tax=Sulfuriferula plumbiphila TaxID=171865 RepID=A0A512L7N3_9PROT|nr:Rne/Rng family ribonuclease [Sulfuriferula plumbiphila]BBP04868.1 ribonuclease E [Sulfuriferula plumbiphila]GEP30141.1 ribonuclease E [Sulfuriferula plumbiphila]